MYPNAPTCLTIVLAALTGAAAQDTAPAPPPPTPQLRAAVDKLKLPGVHINLDQRCIDLDATVCLHEGTLELVACTRDTKEHESIVAVDAKALHIHTALLLLGAKPGHPARRQRVGGADGHWVDVPATGGKIDVSLVVPQKTGELAELPIDRFLTPTGASQAGDVGASKFPTHTFLFAGSTLAANGDAPRRYLADRDGNVVSIATFGDEVLCLPDLHSNENGALLWQVDNTCLPPVGAAVTLRLRPQPTPPSP